MYGHPSPQDESGSELYETDENNQETIDTPINSGNDIPITMSFDDFRSSSMQNSGGNQ